MDHAIEVNDERPNFIDYLDTLDLDTVQRINAAGQSFFTALVQDEQVIPMESIEKERLCALMRASLKTTLN
jgi:hypothetical protein